MNMFIFVSLQLCCAVLRDKCSGRGVVHRCGVMCCRCWLHVWFDGKHVFVCVELIVFVFVCRGCIVLCVYVLFVVVMLLCVCRSVCSVVCCPAQMCLLILCCMMHVWVLLM